MALLGVNIDHVATLRQARRGHEPEPLEAAFEAARAGAEIITIHLREDRRHVQDRDAERLAQLCPVRLNLEMAATDEMATITLRLRSTVGEAAGAPHTCTLVPEGRHEVTTEGGLDVASQVQRLTDYLARLRTAKGGITTSAFIDPDPRQVEAAKAAGFDACELHTGPYAAAFFTAGGDPLRPPFAAATRTLADAAHRVRALGMRLHAGHALNYANVRTVAALPGMAELHVGHAIVSRAVFTGLGPAVKEIKRLIETP
jgi:pyridoxine 5-phosphate synthase